MRPEVLLIYPKTGVEVVRTPLSVLAVAAPLCQEGYNVKVIDLRITKNFKEKIKSSSKTALAVGISAMTGHQIISGLEAAEIVRETNSNLPIVWGGFHPTLLSEQTIKHPLVDAVVAGQGENTFLECVQKLEKNKPFNGIKGLIFKENGKIYRNQKREFEDIKKFPPMPYHLVDVEDYILKDISGRSLDYISSRGCPHRCGFCAISKFCGRKWQWLEPKRVVEEIKELKEKYKVDGIKFEDDNFFVSKERAGQIFQEILAQKLDIKWFAMCRCNYFANYEEKYIDLMKKSGAHEINFGAESGSPKILNMIDKDITTDQIIKCAEICKNYDITTSFSFMMGFPHETFEDLKHTLTLMGKVHKTNPKAEMAMNIYAPYPGTELYELAVKEGFKEPNSLEEWGVFSHNKAVTPWITGNYKQLLEALSYISWFVYSPTLESKLKKKYLQIAFRLLRAFEMFRWKHRFFAFPLEYALIKYYREIFR
jgi:radical SAM superfamily enzyme YgiQ (UPF0313 family)